MTTRPVAYADPGRIEIHCHHSPPTLYPEETHGTVQICVPLENARYDVIRQSETGKTLTHHLCTRDILSIPIGQPHSVAWRCAADIVSLQMSERFISEVMHVPGLFVEDMFTLRDRFVSAAACELRQAFRDGDNPGPAFAESIATIIACRVGFGAASGRKLGTNSKSRPFSSAQAARLVRFIDEHLDQPISLAMLAEQTGMSLWYFIRRFQASYGLPPHAFITRRRLARAQNLLESSELTITNIALEIGLSHSHFSRSFLASFGVSPREFRRQRRS